MVASSESSAISCPDREMQSQAFSGHTRPSRINVNPTVTIQSLPPQEIPSQNKPQLPSAQIPVQAAGTDDMSHRFIDLKRSDSNQASIPILPTVSMNPGTNHNPQVVYAGYQVAPPRLPELSTNMGGPVRFGISDSSPMACVQRVPLVHKRQTAQFQDTRSQPCGWATDSMGMSSGSSSDRPPPYPLALCHSGGSGPSTAPSLDKRLLLPSGEATATHSRNSPTSVTHSSNPPGQTSRPQSSQRTKPVPAGAQRGGVARVDADVLSILKESVEKLVNARCAAQFLAHQKRCSASPNVSKHLFNVHTMAAPRATAWALENVKQGISRTDQNAFEENHARDIERIVMQSSEEICPSFYWIELGYDD